MELQLPATGEEDYLPNKSRRRPSQRKGNREPGQFIDTPRKRLHDLRLHICHNRVVESEQERTG